MYLYEAQIFCCRFNRRVPGLRVCRWYENWTEARISRSLFFTTQLLELGVPVVVALNKSDINKKKKTDIDTDKLSEKLGVRVSVSENDGYEFVRAMLGAE